MLFFWWQIPFPAQQATFFVIKLMFSSPSQWFRAAVVALFPLYVLVFSFFGGGRKRKQGLPSSIPSEDEENISKRQRMSVTLPRPLSNQQAESQLSLFLVLRSVLSPIWQGLHLYPYVVYSQFLSAELNLTALLGFYHFLSPYWRKKGMIQSHTHTWSLFVDCSLTEGQEENHIYTVGRDFCCGVFLGNCEWFLFPRTFDYRMQFMWILSEVWFRQSS